MPQLQGGQRHQQPGARGDRIPLPIHVLEKEQISDQQNPGAQDRKSNLDDADDFYHDGGG
jgi:hypothetical protein